MLIRESAAPLASVETTVALDSSGFATNTYSRWFDHKWGKEKKRQNWVTAHIMVGVETHVITDALVTTGNAGDAPQLPELLNNTAERFDVAHVCADKAYLSHRNFDAVERIGAVPYIPFKLGTTGEGSALWRKMFGLFQYKNEEFRKHYHARSNVETAFSMIKRKFGASVRAKKQTAQRNETLCKLLAHNLCVLTMATYELGVAVEFWGSTHEENNHVH
jgi:transposase